MHQSFLKIFNKIYVDNYLSSWADTFTYISQHVYLFESGDDVKICPRIRMKIDSIAEWFINIPICIIFIWEVIKIGAQ